MSEPEPRASAPLRLFNHFTGVFPEGVFLWPKCFFTLPPPVHEYFFRRLFASHRGIYQSLCSAFFTKLYSECQRRGLVGERVCWDKENEPIVAKILQDLNFDNTDELHRELESLRSELASLRSSLPKSKRGASLRRPAKGSDESA